MRFFLKFMLFFVFAVPLALTGVVFLAIDDHPKINRAAEITPDNIGRAKRILDKNDPRNLKPGAVRTISVSETDLDLAANYMAQQYAGGSAHVALSGGVIHMSASVSLPRNPVGRFMNAEAVLSPSSPLPRFESLRVGGVPVPGWIADWLLNRILFTYLGEEAYNSARNAIMQVRVGDSNIAVTYQWQSNLQDQLRTALLAPAEQERLRVYQERLTGVTRSLKSPNVSLIDLIHPLFETAQQRSQKGDPVAENRAAIFVLTFYVNDKHLETVIPSAKNWPHPMRYQATLNGRHDFSQHFIVSAALAANAGTPLSDAVGLYKEIEDSRSGSGFSFNDIAADRAGTRFGEWATQSAASARSLQKRLGTGVNERDLMPPTKDLPEFMPEAEFKRRFGGIDASPYKQMMAEIEQRIAALDLYR
jgi:uncharacterized protein YfiM (DUF2279 family)